MPVEKHKLDTRGLCEHCQRYVHTDDREKLCLLTVKPLRPDGFLDDKPLSYWREKFANFYKQNRGCSY
jgi:hypothetical protein